MKSRSGIGDTTTRTLNGKIGNGRHGDGDADGPYNSGGDFFMSTEPMPSGLIHDWNVFDAPPVIAKTAQLDDETLRDGLQSPSVKDPSLDEKLQPSSRLTRRPL